MPTFAPIPVTIEKYKTQVRESKWMIIILKHGTFEMERNAIINLPA